MRWVVIVVALACCGRIGFDRGATGNGDGNNGDGKIAPHDGAPALSCSHYTTLDACRREPGCTPVICDDCPCEAPTLSGCIGRGDNITTACTGTPCVGCCTSPLECGAGQFCFVPESSGACGVCQANETPCNNSTECGDGTCEATPCLCFGKICTQTVCTDDSACTPGEYCAASGHCLARNCDANSDCPPDYDCTGPGGICDRRTCSTDSECSAHCLDGHCFSARGTCMVQGN